MRSEATAVFLAYSQTSSAVMRNMWMVQNHSTFVKWWGL